MQKVFKPHEQKDLNSWVGIILIVTDSVSIISKALNFIKWPHQPIEPVSLCNWPLSSREYTTKLWLFQGPYFMTTGTLPWLSYDFQPLEALCLPCGNIAKFIFSGFMRLLTKPEIFVFCAYCLQLLCVYNIFFKWKYKIFYKILSIKT